MGGTDHPIVAIMEGVATATGGLPRELAGATGRMLEGQSLSHICHYAQVISLILMSKHLSVGIASLPF